MQYLLDPKMDFIFKLLFGNEKHPEILISFLNAVINPKEKIVSVEFENIELNKELIQNKYSRLDVLAKTSNDEVVNVEIQLNDEKNRRLYEAREDALHEKTSALEGAMKKGIKKGIEKGMKKKEREITINLLKKAVLSIEDISEATNLTIKEVRKIKEEENL